MAELVLNKYFIIFIFVFIQLDLLFQICVSYYTSSLKSITTNNFVNNSLFNNLSVYNIFILIVLLLDKTQNFFLFFFSFSLYLLVFFLNKIIINYNINTKYNIDIILIINLSIYLSIYVFNYLSSLLVLLFSLELFTVLYYFYFLNNYNTAGLSILQYKNSLLYFL